MGFFEWIGQNKASLFAYLSVGLVALFIGRTIVYGPALLLRIFLILTILVFAALIIMQIRGILREGS
ncbi:MAG: hypothetical protein D6733_04560 [Methanobacteriota archaeon]|nr:MAG: hypothetical protein D6733_04560 [Euryarchaeota archaeon]